MEAVGKSSARKKKRKREASPPLQHTFFPILISSCHNLNLSYTRKTVDRLLRNHLAFVRSGKGSSVVPHGLISLLPFLLSQKKTNKSLAVLAAEIIGAIALCSIESNEEIASDSATVRMLVADLGSDSTVVATTACHAILDLATAPFSREQLRKFLAVEKLLSVLCQAPAGKTGILFAPPFLDAATILINSCNDNYFLENVNCGMTRKFLALGRKSRINVKDKRRSSELAETIFRLSMNRDSFISFSHDLLRAMIFGKEEMAFERFILSHWENSPILLKNRLEEDLFSTIFDFTFGSLDSILESILKDSVSCPPLASDELDIFCFLEEVRGSLGSDPVNGQDFRLVKTLDLGSGSMEEVCYLAVNQILPTCEEAVLSGYTLAVRGLEFRIAEIARISEALALIFGQPSVGVNAYLTPSGSQGLSRHFDDHCVFICQLLGEKRWVVSPKSTPLLPRLYEDLGTLSEEAGGRCGVEREFVLRRGDILYIPRGCLHEASTPVIGGGDEHGTPAFSLHLTFGIEVEPPFEWEGFVHIALHHWSQSQTQNLPQLALNLFHIAIALTSNQNPLFRKACLVLTNAHQSTSQNPKSIFADIISAIRALTSFAVTIEKTKHALTTNNSLFLHRLRWLRNLSSGGVDFDESTESFEELILLTQENFFDLEREFSHIKYQFCRSVDFECSKRAFETLHGRYKKVRSQYMNGMLSLNPSN